jgi:hypothetical protein
MVPGQLIMFSVSCYSLADFAAISVVGSFSAGAGGGRLEKITEPTRKTVKNKGTIFLCKPTEFLNPVEKDLRCLCLELGFFRPTNLLDRHPDHVLKARYLCMSQDTYSVF